MEVETWCDTVMSPQVHSKLQKEYARGQIVEHPEQFMIKKQAEITWDIAFKAGMQEVVKWADSYCTEHVCTRYAGGNNRLRKECPRCWQAFLKEKGLEK